MKILYNHLFLSLVFVRGYFGQVYIFSLKLYAVNTYIL